MAGRRATRRDFLRRGATGLGGLGLGALALPGLGPVHADETRLDPDVVRLDPEVEPLVRLLEETPREDVVGEFRSRIAKGLTYRDVLATLLLASVRNVAPRPSVGFQFHTVLAVHSCHLASLSSPPEQRWLPLLWGLDYFKSAAARDERQANWTMAPVDESAVPRPSRARAEFERAMDGWDEGAADATAVGLARTAGANDVFEIFARLGCRDFRSIGHKAIYVANAHRTLGTIGWHHAEPVVRSLAYAMTYTGGDPNPTTNDNDADRPFRENRERLSRIRDDWRDGRLDPQATEKLLTTLRTGSSADVCDQIVELLNAGVGPRSVWDALFVGSGELLMRQPGIVGLHTLTTTNALHFAYAHSSVDATRRLVMLQNAAFLPMFRDAMRGRGNVRDTTVDALRPAESAPENVEAIFETVGRNNDEAAGLVLAHLAADDPDSSARRAREIVDGARLMIFRKGDDAHDWKFSSAVLEDYRHVSPAFRDRFLATSVYKLLGTNARDTALWRSLTGAG